MAVGDLAFYYTLYLCVMQATVRAGGGEDHSDIFQRCDFSGNFLISGNFGHSALHKRIGKHILSGNFDHTESYL